MLDKQSKTILNHLISIADENNMVSGYNNIYSLATKYTKNQINDSIDYLKENNYLKVEYAERRPWTIEIKYKGLHYKDFNRIRFNNFFMKSILTPIIVSVITTLLALWLNGFFPIKN